MPFTPHAASVRSRDRVGTVAVGTLVAVVALLLTLVLAPGARAMDKGLQDQGLSMSDNDAKRAQFWGAVKSAKVKRVRIVVRWHGNETVVPADTIARLKRAGAEAKEVGAKLMLSPYAPINRSDVRPDVRVNSAMVKRAGQFFGNLATEMTGNNVAWYSTWNEANFTSMWPKSKARLWVTLSNAVYKAYKAADPKARVLVGETMSYSTQSDGKSNPGQFYRDALCLDRNFKSKNRSKSCRTKLLGDGFAIHTYDFKNGPRTSRGNSDQWTMGNLRQAKAQLKRFARAGRISPKTIRNLHITEFAYHTQGRRKVPTKRAAVWLKQAWAVSKAQGVKSFVWYQLREPKPREAWMSGLISANGTKFPTWGVFKRLR
jgi:hypothetical protein